jgi:SAM-dependent methyltransferase
MTESLYENKPAPYFQGAREDYVAELPDSESAQILELGCSEGGTGALALSKGKCARYVGIELDPAAAEKARPRLSEVLVGNIETMELPFEPETFDALILSEVLEHLVDPWEVVARLSRLLRPGGLVFASSPNVSHYKIIRELFRGRWELTEFGVMDRTHLRWFTPDSFAALFRGAGFEIEEVRPVAPLKGKSKRYNRLTLGRFPHLFMVQTSIRARKK